MKTQTRFFLAVFVLGVVLAGGWFVTKRLTPSRRQPLAAPAATDSRSKAEAIPQSAQHEPLATPKAPLPKTAAARKKIATREQVEAQKKTATPATAAPSSAPSPISNLKSQIAKKLNEELREKPRYDQPGKAMGYYRLKRLPAGETEIPVEKYLTAKTQMDAMPQYSSAQNRFLPSRNEMKAQRTEASSEALGTWTPLGPGNIGGRTRALLIHPTTPNVMYAAGVAGGVWKTTNAGARWEPLTDLMANIAVSCLAFDPSNPNTIYAGTGEGFFNGNAVRGAGIFRTTDGGTNWTQLTATGTFDFYYVNDIVVSKANPQRMYAGTRTGVWRSLDSGATWSKVLNYTDGCLDLVMRTDQTTDYVFAACGTFSGAEIFRNTDAGGVGTWTSVQKETGMGRTSLALAPSNQNIVYALAANTLSGMFRDGLYAVFRSTSNGEAGTWTAQVRNNNPLKLNTILLTNPLGSFRSECGLGANSFANQGWYDNVIAVDPLDANRVWVGGIDLFRSDDGGANWGVASYWWPEPSVPQYAHADQHAIVFHPNYNGTTNKQMFIGNDGGIFRTNDARATVVAGVTAPCNPSASGVRWTALNNNYGVTQFYHGAVFPDGKSYFGGTQDNGTLLGTDANGANGWREIYGGDGGYVAIDPTNPNVLYASTPGGRFRKSTDGGKTFGDAILGLSGANLFITPLAIDPSDPQRLWTGGIRLWRTENGGANWSDPGLSSATPLSAIAVAPQDSNRILVGTNSGQLRMVSMLNEFASTFDLTPRSGFVSSVAFDPTDKQIVYATYSTFGGNHVWKSNVGGSSWQPIDGAGANRLPDIPAHCVAVDPTNPARIFVGTDLGVFVTTDEGANWAIENTGFANAPVEWLVTNTVNNVTSLYAFTHGRGVARINLGSSVCTYSLSATRQAFSAAGGSGSGDVVGSSGCNWTASSNVDWIVLTGGNSGAGNGKVSFYVAPNNFLAQRIGTLSVAGKSLTIIQERSVDVMPPTISITNPVTTGIYKTDVSSITISGTTSDNTAVTQIVGVGDRSGSFSVSGINTWTSANLNLQVGTNKVTITAIDEAGNRSSKTITIIYSVAKTITTVAGTGDFYSRGGFSGDGGPAKAAQLDYPHSIIIDKQGNVFFADGNNNRIRKIDTAGIITTFAGNGQNGIGGDGGPANLAQLEPPRGLAMDSKGNLYVSGGDRIRKIDVNGIIRTVAGTLDQGFSGDGGLATQAKLNAPTSLAIDSADNLYLLDTRNVRVRKITPSGIISTTAGSGQTGFSGDGGLAVNAQMDVTNLGGIGVDSIGNIYIADAHNQRVRKVGLNGIIQTIAGNGDRLFNGDEKPALEASLFFPSGVTIDTVGNIYIADNYNCRIRKVTPDGIITTVTGAGGMGVGGDGGPLLSAQLSFPTGVTFDAAGNMYIADSSNHRIRKIITALAKDVIPPSIIILSPATSGTYITSNQFITIAGTSSDNNQVTHVTWELDRGKKGLTRGTLSWTTNTNPFQPDGTEVPLAPGVNKIAITAWDIAGNSNTATLAVTYNPPNIFSTVTGTRTAGFNLESGSGLASQLYTPETVALDSAGNLYIADKGNHRIRKVTRSGLISTVAGSGQLGSSGDGGLAINAAMNQPNGVAVDGSGNLYISDTNNHRIRKVNSAGIISTIAGTGISGFSGDGGPGTQAQLATPVGITLDNAGDLLIADAANNRIRKLTLSTGVITTSAGNGYGFGGDGGQAAQAQLNFPTAVAIDKAGNLYIADTLNHQVRKVTAAGIISRFAGTGFSGFSGDGGQANLAQFNAPGGLTVDAAGNLYITDQSNNRVRKVAPDGIITTFAGNGTATSQTSDEGGAATNASLNAPAGVAVDTAGNIFIADTNNHRVVVVAAYKSAATVNGASYASTQPVAAEAIVSVFGANLATRDQAVTQLPLPTELAGTSVKVRDSLGIERLASLFYVGKLQVNYQIPAGTAAGFATVTITNGNGEIFTSAVNITSVTPGLFTANQSGNGAAAASVLFVRNGMFRYESSFACDAQGQNCIARQIDLSAGDEVFLELYGTGIRNNGGLSTVTATVGGVAVPVLYANKQPNFIGLDQVNIQLPKALAGRGEVEIALTVDGKAANPVKINLK